MKFSKLFSFLSIIFLSFTALHGQAPYLLFEHNRIPFTPACVTQISGQHPIIADASYFKFECMQDKNWQHWALHQEKKIDIFTLTTPDGVPTKCYFIDRKSDKALLIGQGFLSPKEALIPFFKLFPDYDIYILDYRWKAWHKKSMLTRLDAVINSLKKYIYDAQNEVCAVVKHIRAQQRYSSVSGLGQCYSGLVFTIAQVTSFEQEKKLLFDNLIIESGFYSTKAILRRVVADPKLCWENKYGGTPVPIRWISSSWPIITLSLILGRIWFGENFTKLSMETYLPKLVHTKLLFIHGEKDLVVPISDFELMYKAAANTPHCGFIMPHEHTTSHVKSKELYAYTVDQFIRASTIPEFIKIIQSKLN